MTKVPVCKTCSRCNRKYLWNPDVMWCPYCGPLSMPGTGDVPGKKINRRETNRK